MQLFKKWEKRPKKVTSFKFSSILGTVFLWIFWPSFNAGLASGDQQQRAVFNTYFALAACTCASFVVSSLLDREGRYRMVNDSLKALLITYIALNKDLRKKLSLLW